MTQIIIDLLIIFVAFYIMAKIVDNQFIKSLDNIADWLKLPPSVAGATLMAMGTSAPEISTNLIALFKADSNPAGGVGTIVGSAIFQIFCTLSYMLVLLVLLVLPALPCPTCSTVLSSLSYLSMFNSSTFIYILYSEWPFSHGKPTV